MDGSQRWHVNRLIRTLALRHKNRAGVELAKIGLYPGQETVLIVLHRSGPMTQRQLVDHLGVEPPTLSTMAKRLESGGVISRAPCPKDARSVIVDLTDRGRSLMPRIFQIGQELAEVTLAGMDDETVEQLLTAMNHAIRNLEGNCSHRGDT